ncbi:MAG: hypothetical protein Kow0026_09540 [Oricola sp.]
MPDTQDLKEVLDRLEAGGFAVGPDWHAAHEMCQAREGTRAFDWLHALCHRIEGDDWNAGYWYRRAGKARGQGTVAEEWAAIRAELLSKG